jgi:hypothetical protein
MLLIKKLKKIPESHKKLIISTGGLDLDVSICEKYKIDSDVRLERYKNVMFSLYLNETPLSELTSILSKEFNFDPATAKSAAMDIAGMRLLAVRDILRDDVAEYIRSLGGKVEDYVQYVNKIIKSVEDDEAEIKAMAEESAPFQPPKAVLELKVAPKAAYVFDINKEREDSLKNLKESVLAFLDPANEDLTEEYNDILLQLLIDGGTSVKLELEKALYENQERLTSAPFMLDGKVSSGTVSNWIKYFIATKGSAIFDNIILSAFLVQSPNAKALNEVEKSRLRKLLLLYRNIKFFPDSMPNKTSDGWEVIPTQVTEEVQRELKVVKEKEDQESEKRVQELRAVLAKYPEGSLARRAVEEEMKKLKK